MLAKGATGLKLAFEMPLLVVNVFSDFPTGIALWGSAQLTGPGHF